MSRSTIVLLLCLGPILAIATGADTSATQPPPDKPPPRPPSDPYARRVLELFHVERKSFEDGVLELHYEKAEDLVEDLRTVKGEKNVDFESRGILAGHTEGFILLEPVFRDEVVVEMRIQTQLILAEQPTLRVVVMAGDEKGFYATHFGANLMTCSGSKVTKLYKSANERYRQPPAKWVNRRRSARIKLKYKKDPEEKLGVLQSWLNGKKTREVKIDKYDHGSVGLWWNNVKFYVTEIKVRGRLDPEWLESQVPRDN